jgi:lactate dehydrogenase-like 2-hydroxyacid dehydrogenase
MLIDTSRGSLVDATALISEALTAIARTTIQNLDDYSDGKDNPNCVRSKG